MTIETKKCLECEEDKSLIEFYKTKKGYYSYCKTCHAKFSRGKTVSLIEISKKYRISIENLHKLLKNQDNKCKICKREIMFKTDFRQNRACVDHIKGTHNIRGILCVDCNIGLGVLKDNINILTSAIDYLQQPIIHIGDENLGRIRRNKKRINSSGYLGVTFDKKNGKYKAKLVMLGKSINIGYFEHPEEAAIAYNNYIEQNVPNYKEIITLNIIPERENWMSLEDSKEKSYKEKHYRSRRVLNLEF